MSEKPAQASALQQQWSFWSQTVRKKWGSPRSGDDGAENLTDATDAECLLVLESGSSRHGTHRRHNSSPRASLANVGKVRINPLLAEASLQLPRYTFNRPPMEQQEPLCDQHTDDAQESHNPLLSEIGLRLPVSRLPHPCNRRDESNRDSLSYVLIASDGQPRNGGAGMGPSTCCSGCCSEDCCKCKRPSLQTLVKALVIIFLIAGLAVMVVVFSRKNQIFKLLQWVDKHKLGGAAIFCLLYTLCTVLFVPVLPLAIGGGAVYGVLWGSIIVWVGATTGETAAFLIGRFLLRDFVKSRAATMQIWQALERAIRYEGWKIILLLRLAPLVPFALINYFLGASAARFNQFFWASILGIIPGIVVHVYLGSTIRQMIIIAHTPDADHNIHVHTPKAVQIAIVVVSSVAVLVALLLIGLYARRELLKLMNAHQPSEPSSPRATSATGQLQEPLPTNNSSARHSRSSSLSGGEALTAPLEAPHPVEISHAALNG